MQENKLIIKTRSKIYPIIIGTNLLNKISSILKKNNLIFNKCLIVVDSKIPKKNIDYLKKNLNCKQKIFFIFNSNEKNKTQKSVDKILNVLLKNNFTRTDCLISLGGGITGDVSAFVASLYKRGMKFINIPTTLLAQVDSSIGGKTGINNRFGKNLIGTFFQPDMVISDINILKSLPKREIICGYAEILKHSLIKDKKNFNFLDKNKFKIFNLENQILRKAIVESCKIKKYIVEKDEEENNLRKVLNLGHTFAHAYEATLDYSKRLNHGEAVLLGIKSAAKFSLINKKLSKNIYNKIIYHLNKLKINYTLRDYFKSNKIKKIIKFMKSDKKNKNKNINLILLKNIGKPIINLNFNEKKIYSFLKRELIN